MRHLTDFEKGQIFGRPTTVAPTVWRFSKFLDIVNVLKIVALENPSISAILGMDSPAMRASFICHFSKSF